MAAVSVNNAVRSGPKGMVKMHQAKKRDNNDMDLDGDDASAAVGERISVTTAFRNSVHNTPRWRFRMGDDSDPQVHFKLDWSSCHDHEENFLPRNLYIEI
ncbi:hypothetical protein N7501_008800 [Penicillium viridicatum]|nr:hypothetical protein N7501_008800 [Penicillium viridicatum]